MMNPWREFMRLPADKLAELRTAGQTDEKTRDTLRFLALSMGYRGFAMGNEVYLLTPDEVTQTVLAVKTEMTLDENGDFESYFLVKNGIVLQGINGPVAFLDPVEARKAVIQYGGAVKSFSDLRRAREASSPSKLIATP